MLIMLSQSPDAEHVDAFIDDQDKKNSKLASMLVVELEKFITGRGFIKGSEGLFLLPPPHADKIKRRMIVFFIYFVLDSLITIYIDKKNTNF